MLVSEMFSEIRDHGFDDITDARLLGFINDTYFDVCGRETWPFLEKSSTVTVDATGLVTAPTDIGKVLKFVDTGLGTVLEPYRLDAFTAFNANQLTQTGNPYSYYFIGDALYVYPISTSNSLTLRYISVPSALTSTPDSSPVLPSRYNRVIVLGTLIKAFFMEDDAENAAVASQQYEAKIAQMREDLWVHQVDRPDTIQDVDQQGDWSDLVGTWYW